MKTNKSYTKRLKITKKGKLLARKPGQDHFNAKQTGGRRIAARRLFGIFLKNKDKGRFLPDTK